MKIKKRSSNRLHYSIHRRSNRIIEKVISFVFRKINFDNDSINNLKSIPENAGIVYASFHSTVTSLLILNKTLRKNGNDVPSFAFDLEPYLFQKLINHVKVIFNKIARIFRKKGDAVVQDEDLLLSLFRGKEPVYLSLLSLKVFINRYIEKSADILQLVIETQKNFDEPVYICPQIIFWNRTPEKKRSLYSRGIAGDRGIISGFLSSLISPSKPFIRIAAPINIKEELANCHSDDSRHLAGIIRSKLLEIYNTEKRTVIGPVLKTRQEMMEKVLYHKNVLNVVAEKVENSHEKEKKIKKRAVRYYKEIAADFSITYIRIFDKVVRFLFKRIFKSIEYELSQLKVLREYTSKGPLIFVPAYKSQMDYLIISSILYQEKIVPPHVIAGNNMVVFPLKSIYRKCGALFIRDSFRGDELYTVVFRQYINNLVNEGYNLEFYIEGTRSRSGKLTQPRFGVLKYLSRAIEEGYNTDFTIVPISISYDKVIEERPKTTDPLVPDKSRESVLSVFKNNKLLKKKYGKVYISFQEPLSYRSLIPKNAFSTENVEALGYTIARKINQGVRITPRALVSMAMLISSNKGFSFDILTKKIELLIHYAKYMGTGGSTGLDNIKMIIDDIISSYNTDGIIQKLFLDQHPETARPEEFYITNKEKRISINYYKNNIVHFFVPLSFICLILLSQKNNELKKHDLETSFLHLVNLFEFDFILCDEQSVGEVLSLVLAYLAERGEISVTINAVVVSENCEDIYSFARIVQDSLESYLIVCSALMECKSKLSKKELLFEIRKKGITMFHLGDVSLHESLSLLNYQNALKHYMGKRFVEEQLLNGRNVIYYVDWRQFEQEVHMLQQYLSVFMQDRLI